MILFTKRSLLALAACVISLSSSRLFAQDSRHGYYAPPAIETIILAAITLEDAQIEACAGHSDPE